MKELLKKRWMWIVYLVLFAMLVAQRIYAFAVPGQSAHLYHKILMLITINMRAVPWAFVFAIASMLLNVFTLMFLWVYILDKRSFSILFILLIIVARILCDALGHSYEWNMIKSLYFQNPRHAYNAAATLFFWTLPSYLAMGDYVWQKLKNNKQIPNR